MGGSEDRATVNRVAQLRSGNFPRLFPTPTLTHFLKILLPLSSKKSVFPNVFIDPPIMDIMES